jgi:CRISPR-associated endoribonuclease Cas6
MRIQLSLKATKTVPQEHFFSQYFTDMHGFLTSIAGKDEKYGKFCFGNLFPIENQRIETDKTYSVIISSSEPDIIEKIFFSIDTDEVLNIGELQFRIQDIQVMKPELNSNRIIESISPINITTHENGKIRFHKFNEENYLQLLQKNILNKYEFLRGKKPQIDLFENIEIKPYEKQPFCCFQINFFNKEKNKNFKVCGNKLVFKFKNISQEQLEIFQTIYDAGIGERTTYGAGFMIQRFEK